jgi:hypothetical protein
MTKFIFKKKRALMTQVLHDVECQVITALQRVDEVSTLICDCQCQTDIRKLTPLGFFPCFPGIT